MSEALRATATALVRIDGRVVASEACLAALRRRTTVLTWLSVALFALILGVGVSTTWVVIRIGVPAIWLLLRIAGQVGYVP